MQMKNEEWKVAESAEVTEKGKGRYKMWAIAGIIMLALWSLLVGSVSLKAWSLISPISDSFDVPVPNDLDVLELEEREKVVSQLWNVYTHGNTRLPKFWLEAFKAAYEDLISDVSGVRDRAVSEIATLSVRSIPLESPPARSKRSISSNNLPGRLKFTSGGARRLKAFGTAKTLEQTDEDKMGTVTTTSKR